MVIFSMVISINLWLLLSVSVSGFVKKVHTAPVYLKWGVFYASTIASRLVTKVIGYSKRCSSTFADINTLTLCLSYVSVTRSDSLIRDSSRDSMESVRGMYMSDLVSSFYSAEIAESNVIFLSRKFTSLLYFLLAIPLFLKSFARVLYWCGCNFRLFSRTVSWPIILKNLRGEIFAFVNSVTANFWLSALSGVARTIFRYLCAAALILSIYERVLSLDEISKLVTFFWVWRSGGVRWQVSHWKWCRGFSRYLVSEYFRDLPDSILAPLFLTIVSVSPFFVGRKSYIGINIVFQRALFIFSLLH